MSYPSVELTDTLIGYLELFGKVDGQAIQWPPYEREYLFNRPDTKHRFDLVFPAQMVAIEMEGGTFTGGRHTRGVGYAQDCWKYNRAAELGWRVLRYTTDMINNDPEQVIMQIARVLGVLPD